MEAIRVGAQRDRRRRRDIRRRRRRRRRRAFGARALRLRAGAGLSDADGRIKALEAELKAAKERLKAAEAALEAAQQAREGDAELIKKLQGELEDARVDKEGLEQEFALIVDQIGFLTEYSK